MSFDYLNEAFKKLDLLNEETFNTSLSGINELSDFKEKDDATDIVRVIDPEAEEFEELQDSYIGKVITNCNVCHSHIYENKEDIVIDDEGIVNPEKECPYCGERSGFVIVGEIVEFDSTTNDTDTPKVTVDDQEIDTNESEDNAETDLTEAFLVEGKIKDSLKKLATRLGADAATVLRSIAELLPGDKIYDIMSHIENKAVLKALESGNERVLNTLTVDDIEELKQDIEAYKNGKNTDDELEEDVSVLDRMPDLTKIKGTIADVLINHSAEIDACGANEFAVKSKITDILSSGEVRDQAAADEAIRIINNCRGPKLWSTIGTYMSGIKVVSPRRSLYASLETEDNASKQCLEDVNNVNVETDDSIVNVHAEEGGKVTVSTEPKTPESTGVEAVGPISDDTISEIEANNDQLDIDETEIPFTDEDSDIESTDVDETTDDAADEETVEDESTEEAVTESLNNELVDVEIDEVDEVNLDKLGESYLKSVYENVDSFLTTSISSSDSQVIVEGIIKFNSGARKTTGFIFNADSATTNGDVKFVGMNEHFSKSPRSFTLTGKVANRKLLPESLSYDYTTMNEDGTMRNIRGTITA